MKYYLPFLVLALISACQGPPEKTMEKEVEEIEGYYYTGTQSFRWTDPNRTDPYYGHKRVINVKIWYPTKPIAPGDYIQLADYYPSIEEVWQQLEGWTKEDLEFVKSIKTNSVLNAPIAERQNKYPLLVFSPSLGGHTSLYTYYAERFAKKGFIVAGVNHLYESEYVIDEQRKVFSNNITFHDSLKQLNIPAQLTADEFRAEKSKRTKVLGEDLIFGLDKLQEINKNQLAGKIDFRHIGAWGHSIGGAAATYAGILDKRFKAVINLDGTPPSIGLEQGIDLPFMFIEDLTDYKNHNGYRIQYDRRSDFCQKGKADAYRILIGGISHNSFLDIHYHSAKEASAKEAHLQLLNSISDYMLTFFNKYLNGASHPIEEIQTDSLELIKFEK